MRFAGLLGASVGVAVGLGPSLLPRPAMVAALVAGLCAALGYAVAVLIGWTLRRIRRQPHWRASTGLRRAAVAAAAVVISWGAWRGLQAQQWQADQMGSPPPGATWAVLAVSGAVLVAAVIILLASGIRRGTAALGQRFTRIAPPPVAAASAVSVVLVIGVVLVARGPVAVSSALTPLFVNMNAGTAAGVALPASPVVSGAVGSAVSWQSLGHEGRSFIAGVTPAATLQEFSGRQAQDPIRVYAGVDSAPDLAGRVGLVLDDLDRFGAWDRAVLAVGTSTGNGTVDQGEVAPLEYLTDGDVATASLQYSLLPSFLSFLVDRQASQQAGKALFDAVWQRWQQLPREDRPRLVVFGESLGAYGGDAAFADLADLARRTDGALFVGPPNATRMWSQLTADRTAGTPEWLPQYQDGRVVRWAVTPTDLATPATPWPGSRVVYLQHATDPVVWWGPELLWSAPAWLEQPRGPDVSPELHWLPVVTYVLMLGDMMNSQAVPAGNGHVYGSAPAEVWASILALPGWTPADTERLAALP